MTDESPAQAHTPASGAATRGSEIRAIVGVGASAGGITALQLFFSHVPAQSGAAYVVVLHLSPAHESRLAEVLQTAAAVPVVQVNGTVPIAVDHVYVVSPNHNLAIADGSLVTTEMARAEQRRAPIDIFFRSLADVQHADVVSVVLSGTGTDGSTGLKRVKEHGGLIVAQDPQEAEYGDMPANAIATGLVDYVLPASEMSNVIQQYQSRVKRSAPEPAATAPATADGDAMRDVVTLLRVRTGHDFAHYKPATVRRRIERRIHVRDLNTMVEYAQFIRERPDEADALMKELLISVTQFFRDPAVFAALAKHVIPRLFEGKRSQDHVRVWVPGCATGEEAYSIGMLLCEAAPPLGGRPSMQIFASDLDEAAIAVAREGVYSTTDVIDVSDERLRRFFVKEPIGYRVRRDLRELVLFARHDVIKDPPFSHLDLVSCRNLLIYLNRQAQERLIETFHFALRPQRYLLLGSSETADAAADLFGVVDRAAHLYESRDGVRPPRPVTQTLFPGAPPTTLQPAEFRKPGRISPVELHQRLLEQFAPPSIVVTDAYNIVHVSETAGRYLQMSGGEPSSDLLRLIRAELRVDLRTALHQAARQRATVEVRSVSNHDPEGPRQIGLVVRPVLEGADSGRGFFVVLFEDTGSPAGPVDGRIQVAALSDTATRALEEDLARAKSQLNSTIEQYEAQVEEARASNEELQALNEELQSAAEELTTSKEELQSVNEELTTVNQELTIKIEELGLTNNDFQNLIRSTEIATVFLDRALRVKLSTPKAQEIFNLLGTDVGRPLSDITSRLVDRDLQPDITAVLERLITIEDEVHTRDNSWYQMRIIPYRTTDDRIEGVVMTFQDITDRQTAEQRVRASEERLRLLIDSAADYAIFTMTLDGVIDSWNTGAERMFGFTSGEIVGRPVDILFTPEDRAAGVPGAERTTAAATGRAEDERWHLRKDGTRLYCSGVTTKLGDRDQIGFAKIARDLTGDRRADEALQRVHDQLEERVLARTADLQAEVGLHTAAQGSIARLVRRLVSAQEDERTRIARDLHDQLGQQLTALRLALERLQEQAGSGGGAELERALVLAREIDSEVDFLAWELRPAALDDLGLATALPRFVAEWTKHYGIAAECRTGRVQAGDLSRDGEVVFYRVAQEALNNVVKHAQASRVDVLLETRDDSVVLVVEDDGVGFDVADRKLQERGIGLVGMRERAALVDATLQVESAPGNGTSVFLRRPIRREEPTR